MNNTKDQFNSAKKTLRNNLNKSNSVNNIDNNLNFNNGGESREKKNLNTNNSPKNINLLEKITSLLNKNKAHDIITNEYNIFNVENFNYSNNTNKNSNNLNKNLLNIIKEKNSKITNNLFIEPDDYNYYHETENNIFSNLSKRNNEANFLSPPSSKKRIVEKFYNYTENKTIKPFINIINENKSQEKSINQNVLQTSQTTRQKNYSNYRILKNKKFDFSNYNFKSQDLTGNNPKNKKNLLNNESVKTSKEKDANKNYHNKTCKNSLINNNFIENLKLSENKCYIHHEDSSNNRIQIKNSVEINNLLTDYSQKNEQLAKNIILRDVKSLHLITQKALTSKNQNNNDSIDDKKKLLNVNNSTKKALFIDDNSELTLGIGKSFKIEDENKTSFNNYENIVCKTDSNSKNSHSNSFTFSNNLNNYNLSERERKQIINIININNNYNIGNFNFNSNNEIYSLTNPNSLVKNKYDAIIFNDKNKNSEIKSNNRTSTENSFNKQNVNKNISNLNTPSISVKSNNSNLKNSIPSNQPKKIGNINNINEFLNTSKEKSIPNTSKNIYSTNLNFGNDNNNKITNYKIKEAIKNCKKEEK